MPVNIQKTLPPPSPIDTRPLSWTVLPSGETHDEPLIALTAEQYENLALTMADINRFVAEAMAIITELNDAKSQGD